MMAGILLFGLSDRNAGLFTSASESVTRCGSYARPSSSSAMENLLAVGRGVAVELETSREVAPTLRVTF